MPLSAQYLAPTDSGPSCLGILNTACSSTADPDPGVSHIDEAKCFLATCEDCRTADVIFAPASWRRTERRVYRRTLRQGVTLRDTRALGSKAASAKLEVHISDPSDPIVLSTETVLDS